VTRDKLIKFFESSRVERRTSPDLKRVSVLGPADSRQGGISPNRNQTEEIERLRGTLRHC
jgi:hypothetical protein